ncbi:hypothetical protein [Geoalkalibacter halelectricus]|uniref:Lipoprotein n=1 Tax=Geoalkalibacter halelectricus TaxID=2847045 RepID=A0ABY5ZM91_9BACT|nr:hypothetical protein [Geoalkalibacter halelectricus]MDO3378429.1 hypothetical protein [Geoalkalibacter halelectricus]UWZ80251.1 hypothetical protein L9S41_02350 [Geoalkalibacter halelectricus]
MKTLMMIVLAAALCAGCATFEEAYYIDREFGQAQMESWNKMIAYPDGRYADREVEGLDGIHAEPAMGVYHRSYSKEPTRGQVFQLGIIGN